MQIRKTTRKHKHKKTIHNNKNKHQTTNKTT